MLALVFLVLSVLAAPAAGAADAVPADPAGAVVVVWTDAACCGGESAGADVPDPCTPGESCPDSGGCCACVACCKRVANAPQDLRPDASDASSPQGDRPGGLVGIEEVGAVWHPPRG